MANANTTTRTATATDAMAVYADKLATWPTAYAGPAPSTAAFKAAHAVGAKPGTKTAIAMAMYFRPKGATQSQVTVINNGPYLNKARAVIAAGHAVSVGLPAVDGHKVYKLALPEKAASKAASKRKANGKGKAPAKPATATDKPATAENTTAENTTA